MRLAVRFILPLLLALAVVAAVAQPLLDRLATQWFLRDLDARTTLIASAIEESLTDLLQQGQRPRIERYLDHITRDERLYAIGVCTLQGEMSYRSRSFPQRVSCPDGAPTESVPSSVVDTPRGEFHVAVRPVQAEDGATLFQLVFVHDMAFVQRRSADARHYLQWLFLIVAVVVSAVAVGVAHLSRRGWIAAVRAALRDQRSPRGWTEWVGASDLHPVTQDLRTLLADLEIDRRGREEPHDVWSIDALRQLLDEHLKGQEVLIVSNREPYIHERHGGAVELLRPASGLVTALEPVARACKGTWIAHGSGSADRETVDARDHVAVPPEDPAYTLRRVWITKEEETGYYYGFANSGLWPLCHNAHVRPSFIASDWEAYRTVNQKFADAICAEATTPDPFVLVQDFHFALVPRMVRERLPDATIITFWHIPWPNPEAFGICPWHDEILAGMLGSSILGFHTQNHCNNFFDTVDRTLEARVDRETFTIFYKGEPTTVHRYPISIEWPPHGHAMDVSIDTCRREVRQRLGLDPDVRIVLGVDRLDYTKGIVERFLSFERLLELHPQWVGRVVFLQVAAPSRSRIEEYHAFEERVIALTQRINERFGRPGYVPICLRVEHHEFDRVQLLYRASDVCVVTSLHDGMNLVSKEFVAARDDEAGVLIVSQFAGASRELQEALIVNPYDTDQCAAAFARALEMPIADQRDRMRSLRAVVKEYNVYRWAGRMLLDGIKIRDRRRVLGWSVRPSNGQSAAIG